MKESARSHAPWNRIFPAVGLRTCASSSRNAFPEHPPVPPRGGRWFYTSGILLRLSALTVAGAVPESHGIPVQAFWHCIGCKRARTEMQSSDSYRQMQRERETEILLSHTIEIIGFDRYGSRLPVRLRPMNAQGSYPWGKGISPLFLPLLHLSEVPLFRQLTD